MPVRSGLDLALGSAPLCLIGFLGQLDCPDPELLDNLRFDCGFRKSAAFACLFAQRDEIVHPMSSRMFQRKKA
jgi:hypothetical protein